MCKNVVVLRIAVAGGEQPFVFACPHCGTEQHARFYARPEGPYELRSDDFTQVDTEPADALAVPVVTDMPVHADLIGVPASKVAMTSFIQLASTLGNDTIQSLMDSVERLRALNRDAYAPLRRAASFFARGELEGVRDALASMTGGEALKSREHDPYDV